VIGGNLQGTLRGRLIADTTSGSKSATHHRRWKAVSSALIEFDQWQRNESAKSASWWIFFFWATTVTGVAAAMLLSVSFVHALFSVMTVQVAE